MKKSNPSLGCAGFLFGIGLILFIIEVDQRFNDLNKEIDSISIQIMNKCK